MNSMRKLPEIPTWLLSPLLIVVILGVSACSYRKEKLPQDDTAEIPAALLQSVSYSMVSARVFRPYCISCHGAAGGVSLESFGAAKSVLERLKQTVIVNRSMPKTPNAPLSHEEILVLAAWIQMGGPETPVDGGPDAPLPPLPVLEPTFASIKNIIIDQKCIRCHSAGGTAARIPLVTLDDFLNSPLDIVIPHNADESGLVLDLLEGARKKMPPLDSGYSPVSAHEIDIIKEWINNGATN